MKSVRIEVPQNPTLLIVLALAIKAKSDALGANTPLDKLDWVAINKLIADAGGFDVEATRLHREAEKMTEKRDELIPEVAEFVRSARNVLLGLNPKNPRVLSDYGFVVNDSVSAKKTDNGTTPPTP